MPLAALAIWLVAASVNAADPPRHFLNAGAMPPGAIGAQQLLRGGPLPGYFQPVEVRAPEGGQIAFAMPEGFSDSQPLPAKAGMLIGSVYRLKVTSIPRHEGEELYPTIEVIDRLYPPLGQELKFPIPIELAQEDLDAAFAGKFVTRIIYLENPRGAYPRAEDPKAQYYFEVGAHEDPLVVADRLGRPMAILRIGGRTPDDPINPGAAFLFNSPPLLRIRPKETNLPAPAENSLSTNILPSSISTQTNILPSPLMGRVAGGEGQTTLDSPSPIQNDKASWSMAADIPAGDIQ
jgi:hypothetical protein